MLGHPIDILIALRSQGDGSSAKIATNSVRTEFSMSTESGGRDIHVIVIFSHGVGLETWHDAGILEREVAYYRDLAASVGTLTFVTYDRGGSRFGEPPYQRPCPDSDRGVWAALKRT